MGSRNKEQVAGQCVRNREERGRGEVLITIMLGFSFIQYTNTWLSHKAFFITRDIDI